MGIQFFINIWLRIRFFISNKFETHKVFAKNANTFVDSSVEKLKWTNHNNVLTSHYLNMTMHVAYSSKSDTYYWQLGNYKYFERGNSDSLENAQTYASQACLFYITWDNQTINSSYFADIIWKTDNNEGYIASWCGYDFWISPIISNETEFLWRYDIYKENETKSVQSGVTREIEIARIACIRIVEMIAFQNKLSSFEF